MSPELRAREFVTTGFRSLGVPDLEPYIKVIAELIEGAETDARQQVGRAMMETANNYPIEIADVLRTIGERLSVSPTESLVTEGLMVLVDEIMARET